MALQLPHISWWNVSSAQVTRCELHRLEDGCDWLTYKATALKRRLSNFPNECVDIGFLQTTTTKSSDVSCNPFGFGELGSILKGRGDGNVNGKDSGIPLYCVLGNRRKETLVNFDKSFDKRGDLSLHCCSHDASLKTPKNANKFVFQIGQTTKSSARNRKHELCEEYVFELRSVWSGTEVLELVLKVRFEMQGRCSDVLRMTGLSSIRVPVHVKSQAADVNCKYWGTEEETGGVTCDRTSPCCQEKFTIAHHMEENANHTWIEAGDRVLSCDSGSGAARLVKKTQLRGIESFEITEDFTLKNKKSKLYLNSSGGGVLSCQQRQQRWNFEIQSSTEFVILSMWGSLVESQGRGGSVRCGSNGMSSSSSPTWMLRFHGGNKCTIVSKGGSKNSSLKANRRKKKAPKEEILFVEGESLSTTSSPHHFFPSKTSLFEVKPRLLAYQGGKILCFTISIQRGGKKLYLSSDPSGAMKLLGGKASISEMFFILDPTSSGASKTKNDALDQYSSPSSPMRCPASLQDLTCWNISVGCGGCKELEALFDEFNISQDIVEASGLFNEISASGERRMCCKRCGKDYTTMDPKDNPQHYQYLEVQMRQMNGGNPTGRNVGAGSFLKACGTFIAFITATRIIRNK